MNNPYIKYRSDLIGATAATFGQKISLAAIGSLILGIVSFPMMLLCFLSIFISPVSIILGLVGILSVTRGGGRIKGNGLAISGIILGLVSGLLTMNLFMRAAKSSKESGERVVSAMNVAERLIGSDSQGVAHGNTAEAKVIAEELSRSLLMMDALIIERSEKQGISLSGGKYITYCHLAEGSCVFLIHVPGYRKFTGEAKDILREAAWITVQNVVGEFPESVPVGSDLGMGLKGVILYGAVVTGTVSMGEESLALIKYSGNNQGVLKRFFPPPEQKLPGPAAVQERSTEGGLE